MQITNEYYRELMEANGSLEAVGFREHDRQEEELLEKRYERCKQEYDREKAKLDELYAKKKQARQEALQYLKTAAETYTGWTDRCWQSLINT